MVLARPFFRGNERGQALIEYAAIVAVVGACLVAILGLVGRATNRAYQRTASAVSQGKPGFQGTGGVILTGIVFHWTASGSWPRGAAARFGGQCRAHARLGGRRGVG